MLWTILPFCQIEWINHVKSPSSNNASDWLRLRFCDFSGRLFQWCLSQGCLIHGFPIAYCACINNQACFVLVTHLEKCTLEKTRLYLLCFAPWTLIPAWLELVQMTDRNAAFCLITQCFSPIKTGVFHPGPVPTV